MRACLVLLVLLAGCSGGPDAVGDRVGRSLYDASVSTGQAVTRATDATGRAFQEAGAGLRRAVNPVPPPMDAPPLPPAYVPDTGAPVVSQPLAAPDATAPSSAYGY